MRNDIDKLRQAVEQRFGCAASHARSEFVMDTFGGKDVWDGTVEIFALSSGDVRRVYAWSYPQGDEIRYVTVLAKPPITDGLSAVRAAVASGELR